MEDLVKNKNSFKLIQDLVGPEDTVKRLMELGFTTGENIAVVGVAPFGSPILVELRGSVFALRDSEAKCLVV